MTDALNCPFCGKHPARQDPGAVQFAVESGAKQYWLTCACGAMGSGGKTPVKATLAWNRRAQVSDAQRLAYCVQHGFPQLLSSGWWGVVPNGHLIRGAGPIEAIDAAIRSQRPQARDAEGEYGNG